MVDNMDEKNKNFEKNSKKQEEKRLEREIRKLLDNPQIEDGTKLSEAIRIVNELKQEFPSLEEKFEKELTERSIEELKRKGLW